MNWAIVWARKLRRGNQQISPYPIPGVPLEVLGGPLFQARGIPEKNKKNAKASASRAALDILVRKGTIQINEQNFAEFKASIKNAIFCEESPPVIREGAPMNENVNGAENDNTNS